jgi:hypothetical protein
VCMVHSLRVWVSILGLGFRVSDGGF